MTGLGARDGPNLGAGLSLPAAPCAPTVLAGAGCSLPRPGYTKSSGWRRSTRVFPFQVGSVSPRTYSNPPQGRRRLQLLSSLSASHRFRKETRNISGLYRGDGETEAQTSTGAVHSHGHKGAKHPGPSPTPLWGSSVGRLGQCGMAADTQQLPLLQDTHPVPPQRLLPAEPAKKPQGEGRRWQRGTPGSGHSTGGTVVLQK